MIISLLMVCYLVLRESNSIARIHELVYIVERQYRGHPRDQENMPLDGGVPLIGAFFQSGSKSVSPEWRCPKGQVPLYWSRL